MRGVGIIFIAVAGVALTLGLFVMIVLYAGRPSSKCRRCSEPIRRDARFCPRCGSQVST